MLENKNQSLNRYTNTTKADNGTFYHYIQDNEDHFYLKSLSFSNPDSKNVQEVPFP